MLGVSNYKTPDPEKTFAILAKSGAIGLGALVMISGGLNFNTTSQAWRALLQHTSHNLLPAEVGGLIVEKAILSTHTNPDKFAIYKKLAAQIFKAGDHHLELFSFCSQFNLAAKNDKTGAGASINLPLEGEPLFECCTSIKARAVEMINPPTESMAYEYLNPRPNCLAAMVLAMLTPSELNNLGKSDSPYGTVLERAKKFGFPVHGLLLNPWTDCVTKVLGREFKDRITRDFVVGKLIEFELIKNIERLQSVGH